MTALRAAIGPLLIAGSTVGAAWLLIWGFSFGGRFAALFFAACAIVMGWARIRDLERFAFIALGACFSIGISFHLTEWEGSIRAKFGGGFFITLTESWILVLLACWFFRCLRSGVGVHLQAKVLWPAYVMLPFALQAGLRTIEDPVTGIWMFWRFLLALGMALYLANNLRPKEDYRLLAWTVSAVVLFQALVGFGQEITGGALGLGFLGGERNLTTIKGTIEISRMVGTVGVPNRYASFMGIFFIFPFAIALSSSRGRARLFGFFIAVAAFVALMGSKSRGAWLSFLVTYPLAMYPFLRARMTGSRALIVFGWMSTLGMAVALSLPGVWLRLTTEDTGSAEGRMYMAQIATNIIQDNPVVGIGFNNYTLRFHEYDDTLIAHSFTFKQIVHNGFLSTAAEYGLPTMILLGLLWFLFLRRTLHWRLQGYEVHRMLAFLVPWALLNRAIQSLYYVGNPLNMLPMWYLLGLGLALNNLCRQEDALKEAPA